MLLRPLMITAAAAALLAGPVFAQGAAADPNAAAPPTAATPAAPAAPAPIPAAALTPSGDILATVKASPQFTILAKALDASGLGAVLQRPGPFTLIAPTDAAFQALPPAQLADLMKPENSAQLQALLTYHLINASVPPTKIEGTKGAVQTVARKDVQIDASTSPAKFNDATVEGQAKASNGYIYVVDKVLMATPVSAAAPAAAPATPAG